MILAFPRATQVVMIFLMNDYFDETRVRLYWHVEGSPRAGKPPESETRSSSESTDDEACDARDCGRDRFWGDRYRVYYCQL